MMEPDNHPTPAELAMIAAQLVRAGCSPEEASEQALRLYRKSSQLLAEEKLDADFEAAEKEISQPERVAQHEKETRERVRPVAARLNSMLPSKRLQFLLPGAGERPDRAEKARLILCDLVEKSTRDLAARSKGHMELEPLRRKVIVESMIETSIEKLEPVLDRINQQKKLSIDEPDDLAALNTLCRNIKIFPAIKNILDRPSAD